VVRVLLENGARASLFNYCFQRPIDVSAEGFGGVCLDNERVDLVSKMGKEEISSETIDAKRQSRMNLLCLSPQSRTLVLHHPECLEHVPKSESDWEAPDRVNSIMNLVGSNVRDYEVQISTEFDKASLELLSRVHSAEYLTFVNDLSKELEKRRKDQIDPMAKKEAPVVPFTPMVQRTMGRETAIKKGSHSDTSFSSGSLRAARRAAGAVQHAVDCVLVGRNRNAFCVVRPPGHHAGINGLLAGGESCGFCIFNNVAAGAMHALSDEGHRPKCERCAIVDIDAHHGNGTEEIVKKCDDPGRLFFFSVHLYDNDKRKSKQNAFKFYPGTGDEDDVAHNVVNVPIAPMWREKEMTQNAKMSQFEGRNTRNKTKLKAAAAASKGVNVNGSDNQMNDEIVDGGIHSRSRSPKPATPRSTPSHYHLGTGRAAYRRAIQQRLLPALRAFNPDLIILSIGFDASKGDVGNARHYAGGKEAEGINLEPEDYAWTTSRVSE
jgi:acetoin utilization deacetylase AcuC-like enzyme